MILHYLQTALRSMRQQGFYTVICVVGLAIGLTLCTLIALFVVQERSFDRIHPDFERTYRIAHERTVNHQTLRTALTPGPLAPRIEQTLPGVEASCRLYRRRQAVTLGAQSFMEERFLLVDTGCQETFALRFVEGDAASALGRPQTLVLTEPTARKYFGDRPAVGETLRVAGEAYTVTGVVEDISHRSHLTFDLLTPMSSRPSGPWIETWLPHIFYTYVKLAAGTRAEDFTAGVGGLVEQEIGPRFSESIGQTFPQFRQQGQTFAYFLQPLGDIRLDSNLDFELQPNGDRRIVNSLGVMALLILLIACVNYLNLTTARSTQRALEVGLRKAMGAEKSQLVGQFLLEAQLTTAAGAVLAVLLLCLVWTVAGAFLHTGEILDLVARPVTLLLGLGAVLVLGLVAGAYPAFMLASLQPLGMLKGQEHATGGLLRRAMVVLQFTIAMGLMVFVLVVHRQMDFLLRRDLGFHPAGVLVVNELSLLGDRWEGFKQEVLRMPEVVSASAATSVPGRATLEGYLYPETSTREEDLVSTWVFEADPDFVRTLGIRLTEGSDLTPAGAGGTQEILVNSMVPLRLGWPAPVGRLVTVGKVPADIRGVFENVFVESLHHPLQETVIRPLLRPPQVLVLRVRQEDLMPSVVSRLEPLWRKFAPDQPFSATPLVQELARQYEPERRLTRAISAFAISAILLACLGIFGLSAFTAQRRTREIGIRKSFGGTAQQVTGQLSREFLGLVILGIVLALPPAIISSRAWLERFAFHVELPWWLLAAAGVLILFIALVTVGSQTVRAALANPADTLRHE